MNAESKPETITEEQQLSLAALFADVKSIDHVEIFAQQFNLTKHQLQMLTHRLVTSDLYTILELLKAKNHKSAFRGSLAIKVRKWLKDNEQVPLDQMKNVILPLSIKQMTLAIPKWPVHYNIPSTQ